MTHRFAVRASGCVSARESGVAAVDGAAPCWWQAAWLEWSRAPRLLHVMRMEQKVGRRKPLSSWYFFGGPHALQPELADGRRASDPEKQVVDKPERLTEGSWRRNDRNAEH